MAFPVYPDAGYRIVGVNFNHCEKGDPSRDQGICNLNWMYDSSKDTHDGDFVVLAGHNGSWAVTNYIDVWEEKATTTGRQLPNAAIDFAAGETKPVLVSSAAADVLLYEFTATGKKAVSSLVPPGGSALSPITCTRQGDAGDGMTKFVCTAEDYNQL